MSLTVDVYRVGQDDDLFRARPRRRTFARFQLVAAPNTKLVFLNGVLLVRSNDYAEKILTPKGTKSLAFKFHLKRGDLITLVGG